jgi:CRP-like cAMP-binding protein
MTDPGKIHPVADIAKASSMSSPSPTLILASSSNTTTASSPSTSPIIQKPSPKKRWKKAITKVKLMNALGHSNSDQIFRRHRRSVRLDSKAVSFHASVLQSSQHETKLAEIADRSEPYKKCHVLIVPMTVLHKTWLATQVCMVIPTLLLSPWLIGFGLSSSYATLMSNDTRSINVILYVLDILCVIDMISVCMTGYIDHATTKMVLRTYAATSNYILSKSFCCDLISVLPIELLVDRSGSNGILHRGLLLRRMFRLYRAQGAWNFINYLEKKLNNSSLFPILKLLGTIVYVSHFFACMLQLVRYSEGTYGLPQLLDDYSHPDDHSLYTRSLYETIYLLLGESLENVYTSNERIFVYLCVLLGAVLNAWLFGQVAIYVDSMMRESLGYQSMMHDVHAHMDALNLPFDVRSRVVSYFDFLWSRNKSGNDLSTFLEKISPSLKAEISLFQHREVLSRVDFFRGAPVGFIVEVSMRLSSKLFLPGDYVIREDDFGTEMFFVVSGSCECLVKRKVVRKFHANDMFGEIALLKNEPVRRTASIKSELYSELVVFHKTDFLDCLAIHPSAAKGVYKVMREKIEGYTGANRNKLNRSASLDIKSKISLIEHEEEERERVEGEEWVAANGGEKRKEKKKTRTRSFIMGKSSAAPSVAPPSVAASPTSIVGNSKSVKKPSPVNSAYDSGMDIQQFLQNRSAQFGISEQNLINFAKHYANKLHDKEWRDQMARSVE